jgi:thioredoxin 2
MISTHEQRHILQIRELVLKVNTDEQPQLAERYHVRGIPFFAVFRDGRIVHQQAGVVSHDQLQQWLDAAAGPAAR